MICKIKDGLILKSDTIDYETTATFEVVCLYEQGYIIKVPFWLRLKSSFEATPRKCKEYDIPAKFTEAEVQFITGDHISVVSDRRDGECCDHCGDFFPMAERNDEGNFRCFSCRSNPYR